MPDVSPERDPAHSRHRVVHSLPPSHDAATALGQEAGARMKSFITPPTLARLLGVSPRTVTRWCRQGRIDGAEQFVGYASTWRIPIEALAQFGVTDLTDSSESGRSPVQDATLGA
jgi:excisionase family DNA binding protein